MNIKLLKLIYDYSRSGKLVDHNYVDKLIEIVIEEKKLNKYVIKSQILSEKESFIENGISLAQYNPFSKTISIYANGINQMLEFNDRYLVLFGSTEQLFYKNSLITQIILHELEHANQRKIIDTEQTLEAEILKLITSEISFNTGMKLLNEGYSIEQIITYISIKKHQSNENYKKNYNIAPEERLAEIKSYQEILELLFEIKEYVPNLLEFEQTNKLEQLLRGFDYKEGFIYPPTVLYLIQNGNAQALNRFDWYNEDYYKCLQQSKSNYSL